jgi:hypothetical protein
MRLCSRGAESKWVMRVVQYPRRVGRGRGVCVRMGSGGERVGQCCAAQHVQTQTDTAYRKSLGEYGTDLVLSDESEQLGVCPAD